MQKNLSISFTDDSVDNVDDDITIMGEYSSKELRGKAFFMKNAKFKMNFVKKKH